MKCIRFVATLVCLAFVFTSFSAYAQQGDRALVYCGSGPACSHGFDGLTAAFNAAGADGVDVWEDVMPDNPDFSPYRIIVYYWPSNVWPTDLRINDELADFHAAGGVIIAASGYADTENEMADLASRIGLTTRPEFVSQESPSGQPVDSTAHALVDGVASIFTAPNGRMNPNGGTTLVADGEGNLLVVVEDRVIFSIKASMWSDSPGFGYVYPADENPRLWENIWRFYDLTPLAALRRASRRSVPRSR